MACTVLLIDANIEALSDLASILRSRGLVVALADSWPTAEDQARKTTLDAILVAENLARTGNVADLNQQHPSLPSVPCFTLVDGPVDTRDITVLSRHDPDLIARRLWSLEGTAAPLSTSGGDFRGDLQQIGVTDLLQVLSMNQRTGVLTISTPLGLGEVRLVQGEIVDAIYRKIEGSKALYRLLGESDGSFAFVSGTATASRRVEQPTHVLLLDGLRQVDETRRTRLAIGSEQDAFQSLVNPNVVTDELARATLIELEVPHTLDELLDLLSANDLAIVKAVEHLLGEGLLRRIERGALRVDLASPEQMNVLSTDVRQLRRPGFSGNPRIALFASQSRLGAAMHSLSRIADAWRPVDAAPAAPVPRILACLRLNDGAELDVLGVPDSPEYGPLWEMTLPGSAAVIMLGSEPNETLEAACQIFAIPVMRAEALIGAVEEGDPQQMALLIRSALEAASSR